MLVAVSPAKKLDFSPPPPGFDATMPTLAADTALLAKRARQLTRADLARLMKLSGKLAELNFQRYQSFGSANPGDGLKQAVFAFSGDTYVGLDAASLSVGDIAFAQDYFRILSGLYGVLRPLDLIEPHRLEMGTRLDTERGANLYEFWDGRPAETLNEALGGGGPRVVVNLASAEYFKSVKRSALDARVITPKFLEIRDGRAKTLALWAKRARGMMARFVITERIDDPEGLKDFSAGGYRYQPDGSDADCWLFTRDQP